MRRFRECRSGSSAGRTDVRTEEPRLVVVCGLPGVGKTTVSRRIADRLACEILRTDVVRKELFEAPVYTDEETTAVYDELFERARSRIESGDPVVLDATFRKRSFRTAALGVAESMDVPFRLVEVVCEEPVVEERIERRDGVSDADFEIHLRFKRLFEPIEIEHLTVDNSATEAETLRQVDAAF